jgi:hypothetical protein
LAKVQAARLSSPPDSDRAPADAFVSTEELTAVKQSVKWTREPLQEQRSSPGGRLGEVPGPSRWEKVSDTAAPTKWQRDPRRRGAEQLTHVTLSSV